MYFKDFSSLLAYSWTPTVHSWAWKQSVDKNKFHHNINLVSFGLVTTDKNKQIGDITLR